MNRSATPNLGFHPCGRPQELVQRGSKRAGTKAGQVRPCKCLICGPVDGRLSRWRLWSADRYRGNYRCTGVEGIEGCGRVTWCAGPTADQMICRDCLRIPAAPQAAAKAAPVARAGRGAVKRGRAA